LDVGGVRLRLANDRACLAVLSLDGAPLGLARRLLVTAVGESVNTDMVWDGRTLVHEGQWPILIDPVVGTVRLPAASSRCQAWALDAAGARVAAVPTRQDGDGWWLTLGAQGPAIHYEVVCD
jgi:hypothetical protein